MQASDRKQGINKSWPHPQEDELVERMNQSLLNLLHTFVEKEGDSKQHLQLLL